jgi:L-ascorbate metabolism protein UlaG (beta-lactamase superfamily)
MTGRLTTPASAKGLRRRGFTSVMPLQTWQSHELTKDGGTLRITAAPGTHATGPARALLPPVMGSVLTFTPADGPAMSVYVTGDTLVHDDLRELPQRHPSLDLGLWHLGGTRIPGLLGLGLLVTMDGRQGAELLELARPARTVPIHHGDYTVLTGPVETFLADAERRGLTGVTPVERGVPVPLPLP